MPYGGVYSKVSAASLANPKNTQLQTLTQTVFRGTTLRAMLLNAYGWSEIATVMLWGAIASFIGAACMAVLVGLGFWHARRTEVDERMLAPKRSQPPPDGQSDNTGTQENDAPAGTTGGGVARSAVEWQSNGCSATGQRATRRRRRERRGAR
jgi:hypothetical protein